MEQTLEDVAPISSCLQHLRVLYPDPEFNAWLLTQRAAAWASICLFFDRPVYSTGCVPSDAVDYLEIVNLNSPELTFGQHAAVQKNKSQIPAAVLRASVFLYLSSANEHRESVSEKPLSINPAYLNLLHPYRRFSDK